MDIIYNPAPEQWGALTRRNIPAGEDVAAAVAAIIADVRNGGDEALRRLAQRFDNTAVSAIEVSAEEIAQGCSRVDADLARAIRQSIANVEAFHRAQLPARVEVETMEGVRCIQKAVPVGRVGLYIPGGRAPLFSTVVMLAVPARIAGCPEVILCTPQGHDQPIAPAILFAARECGVGHIYRVGGAQAIAAMAYGTETIGRVDKIFGPGNRYVTTAKQLVSSAVAIDMPAGPSEVLVMADETANPLFVATDLLSQAEHGPDSQSVCVCTSMDIARAVAAEIEKVSASLSRTESISRSLSHSHIVVLDRPDLMVDFVNEYAPEHLIISMESPWAVASRITNAGSVFIGNFSPESAGDYASGTNHTLPTNGWARAFSGVNIDSYMRKITYQELTPAGLESLSSTIITMAEAEGLDAHAMAVKVRLQK